jgi:hypothetical protein
LDARVAWATTQIPKDSVIIDSGCEQHIVTPGFVALLGLTPIDADHIYIQFGNGEKCLSTQTVSYGIMKDARIVSTASYATNLLSVSQITNDGYMCTMDKHSAKIFFPSKIMQDGESYTGHYSDMILEAKCYLGGLYACHPYSLVDIGGLTDAEFNAHQALNNALEKDPMVVTK